MQKENPLLDYQGGAKTTPPAACINQLNIEDLLLF